MEAGAIDISVKKPEESKRRKRNEKKINSRIGTRTGHYLTCISDVMDVLDKHDMKGCSIVMDNAPIHTPVAVRKLIESRGCKCLYLLILCFQILSKSSGQGELTQISGETR